MTATFRRLLPALLLALAACVVKTDDLAPKTDAECAPLGQKACGPKCVRLDDPATGCGVPGCSPCPAGPSGTVAFCNYGSCAYRTAGCGVGEEQCDGAGGCEDLQSDPLHCGACFHGCTTNCVAGTCQPVSNAFAPGVVLDFAPLSAASYSFIIDHEAGAWGSGRFVGSFSIPGLGTVDRLVSDPASGHAFVSSDLSGSPTVFEVPPGSNAAYGFFSPEGGIRSMAVTPYELLLTTYGGAQQLASRLLAVDRADPALWVGLDAGLGSLAGVAYVGAFDVATVGADAGTLGWHDLVSSSGVYQTGIPAPTQIAIYSGTVGLDATLRNIAFWASEVDGSVRAMELPTGPVWTIWPPSAGSGRRMDIHSDAAGVYWSDDVAGIVAEWRAAYDDVVLLNDSTQPTSVMGLSSWVYWADWAGFVHHVPQ